MQALRFPLERLDELPFDMGAPPVERVIHGVPVFRTWLIDARENDTLFAGVWESSPGKWRIAYDEWEFCSILDGVSELVSEGGDVLRVTTGDSFVLPPGYRGTWEVLETTRKLFVVKTPG